MRRDKFQIVDKFAKETSDKAVEQAINKIASGLSKYMACSTYRCPCALDCNADKSCKEWLAEWMKKIVKEKNE